MSGPADSLRCIEGARFAEAVPLAAYTTWRVGGPAEWLVTVSHVEALAAVLTVVGRQGLPLFVLGNGSNVLVSDAGFGGVTLRLDGELSEVSIYGETAVAGGGAPLARTVSLAGAAGLAGLEFATGIPGSVGGAVMTNAGAAGSSVAAVLGKVETMVVDATAERRTHTSFSDVYRTALVPRDEVVVSATFLLRTERVEAVAARTEEIRRRRQDTQPRGASAGSVFKNPEGDSAGRLIEECGLKGKKMGGASISERHANFIVTEQGATAGDVKVLIDIARDTVGERFGVSLETEVSLVGFEEG